MRFVIVNFNSRPHGGRHILFLDYAGRWLISTHALTEGDIQGETVADIAEISTHALTEGDGR